MGIQHDYHDHADNDGAVYLETPMVSKGGVTVPFPMKLYNMLEHIAQHEPQLSSIVTWQPHGRCFLVHDINKFTSYVLPRFFQQRKYASFQRQLNLYGFTRLTTGPDRGSYYHELFLRSKKILCRGINRMKVKGTGSRMASNPNQEPNFYRMSSMPPSGSDQHGDTSFSKLTSLSSTHPDKSSSISSSMKKVIPKKLPDKVHSSVSDDPTYRTMPLSAVVSSNEVKKDSEDEDMDDLNFVFDNMPFHVLDSNGSSRRHSLMDVSFARRLSMKLASRRNSMLLVDDEFEKEMEMIALMGEKDLTDEEMGDVLDKIIDHRII